MSTEPDKIEATVELVVPSGYQENERIDVYLTRFMPNVSRSKVQAAIRDGCVFVNDALVKRPSHQVMAHDVLRAIVMRPPPIEAVAEDIPLTIAFEDEHLIVVDKPAGMVVHPAYGNRTGTLVNALLHHVGANTISFEASDEDENEDDNSLTSDEEVGLSMATAAPAAPGDVAIRPGIVHRLDKDTSGLLVVAKSDVVHRELALQFSRREVRRHYVAVLSGTPDPASGRIETWLGRDPRDRKRMAVVAEMRGKVAITNYTLDRSFGVASIVRFRLETGRTHQIRVHAQHMGHPVLGDETYGGRQLNAVGPARGKLKRVLSVLNRQALHAAMLGFVHPITEREVTIESPLPSDMERAIEILEDG